MLYLKVSNGSTTMLVNVNDDVRQTELRDSGFDIQVDSDGVPITVDSDELLLGRKTSHSEMLQRIKQKFSK